VILKIGGWFHRRIGVLAVGTIRNVFLPALFSTTVTHRRPATGSKSIAVAIDETVNHRVIFTRSGTIALVAFSTAARPFLTSRCRAAGTVSVT
jgi:hypothetical protein